MCVMSMVMDHYLDKWQKPLPLQNPAPFGPWPPLQLVSPVNMPTQAEIDEFHCLLARARKYDVEHNEPDCEMEEKRRLLLKLAEEWGVELHFAEPGK